MTVKDAGHVADQHTRRVHLPFRRRERETEAEHQSRAEHWFESSIATWEREGRIATNEADTLRAEITKPQFLAVLPHFGVHLAIGMVLRFPIGSIVRATYVLLNMTLATARLLVRNIDRHAWRHALGIHSPLVLLIAGMPGIGTFAYLASKPIRSNHLLLRVGADAVLMKLPRHVYERTGLRWVIARPKEVATQPFHVDGSPLRLTVWAQSIVLLLGLTVGALFAADIVTQFINGLRIVNPDMMGWRQVARMFDLGAESSFGTWYQVMALALLSAFLAGIGFAKRHAGDRFARHWFILALLSLGFSMDEAVQIHDPGGGTESIRQSLGLAGPIFYGWVILGFLSVIVVSLYYRRFLAALPQVTRRLYVLAAALFVGGELVMEGFSGWYADFSGSESDLVYLTIQSFEELFGMVGILIAIAATLHFIQVHFGEVRVSLHDGLQVEQVPESAVAAHGPVDETLLSPANGRYQTEPRHDVATRTPAHQTG